MNEPNLQSIQLNNAEIALPLVAPVISLDQARAESVRADIEFRRTMITVLCYLFIGLNAAVILFIIYAFHKDISMITSQPSMLTATDRLVTTNVLMSLIGATVVQTGVGFIAIVSYLFPKKGID